MTPFEKLLMIPKQYQGRSGEWCSGYLEGHRNGVKEERRLHKRRPLEELFPEYYDAKKKGDPKARFTFTRETLEARDKEIRNELIDDVYRLIHYEIVKRYKLCYWACLNATLRCFGWFNNKLYGTKRIERIFDTMDKMLVQLSETIRHDDFNGIMTWCERYGVDEQIAKDTFNCVKGYRTEKELSIEDLDFFNLEGEE